MLLARDLVNGKTFTLVKKPSFFILKIRFSDTVKKCSVKVPLKWAGYYTFRGEILVVGICVAVM